MIKIAYLSFPRYLSLPILSNIAKESKKFGVNFYIDTNEEEPNGVYIPDNFDMTIRINEGLVITAYNDMKSKNILKSIKSVNILKTHINDRMIFLNPDAIVTTSDMGGLVTRLCNEWAVKHNRPFFIMQPSFLEVAPETLRKRTMRLITYLLFNKILQTPIGRRQPYYGCERKTNYNLLWSKDFSNQIKDTNNTFYVGNPLLDKFANNKVKLDVKQPKVLICTQPYKKLIKMGILTNEQALEMHVFLKKIIIQNPDVFFAIKIHPSDNMEDYCVLLKDVEISNFIILGSGNFQDYCQEADVQVSMASYTSFEAIAIGIPIIIIHPEYIDFFDQFQGQVELHADCSECFDLALKTALRPWYRKTFAAARIEYLYKKLAYFGNSAEITANTIKKVVERQRPDFK